MKDLNREELMKRIAIAIRAEFLTKLGLGQLSDDVTKQLQLMQKEPVEVGKTGAELTAPRLEKHLRGEECDLSPAQIEFWKNCGILD